MKRFSFFVLYLLPLFFHNPVSGSYLARKLNEAESKLKSFVQEHQEQKFELTRLRNQLTLYEEQLNREQVTAQQIEQTLHTQIQQLTLINQALTQQNRALQLTCDQKTEIIANAQTILLNRFNN